jgi:hypothetical protein
MARLVVIEPGVLVAHGSRVTIQGWAFDGGGWHPRNHEELKREALIACCQFLMRANGIALEADQDAPATLESERAMLDAIAVARWEPQGDA